MALRPEGDGWRPLDEPAVSYRFCRNAGFDACNWLVADGEGAAFCEACRHNRTIPDLSRPGNLIRWQWLEAAKHRLFYSLLKFRLPLATRAESPEGLAFDMLADPLDPQPDLYPFVLSPAVIAKLGFVHGIVRSARNIGHRDVKGNKAAAG